MKSLALISGGLDSTVSLACAARESEVALCLTADYGQKAAAREIDAAKKIAGYFGVPHRVVELPFLAEITGTALVQGEVPQPDPGHLDDPAFALDSARAVWVPNRNGLLINVAACFAEAMGIDLIVTGFNREEAVTFPDNSARFVEAVNSALYFSAGGVSVVSYTQRLNKVEIVELGRRLCIPSQYLWSCYLGGHEPCGRCESCLRSHRAFAQADLRE